LEEERAGNIIDSADGTLGFAILGGHVGLRETEMNAMLSKVRGNGGVDELSPVVSLHGNKRARKLGANIGNKGNKIVGGVRFSAKWKSPHKVGEIIDNNEVIFKTRISQYGRGPKITMY
jgi:hypothetical protein